MGLSVPSQLRADPRRGERESRGNTHRVYLAVCEPRTPGQWWWVDSDWATTTGRWTNISSRQTWDGLDWEMSANSTTPAGQSPGTYGAYTAAVNPISTHRWLQRAASGTNRYRFENLGTSDFLSASAASPFTGDLYRVYPSAFNSASPAPAQVWRYFAPTSPPTCGTCNGHDN